MNERIIVPGNPIAKRRPRFARRGKFVQTYNDQETEESKFLFHVLHEWDFPIIENKSIAIQFIFEMKRPKSHFGTGKNSGKLKQKAPYNHTKKPDIDNMVKFCLDVLNGVVFKDDSLITFLVAEKRYSENPRTIINISS
jgi:Holliday junction resolvase RusA-like endonuclease